MLGINCRDLLKRNSMTMEKQYKTFEDLVFEDWAKRAGYDTTTMPPLFRQIYAGHKQAVLEFDNGYAISVLFGSTFYSDGKSTYEVGIIGPDGKLRKNKEITGEDDFVIGYQTKEQVTEIMKQVQDL